MQINGTAPSPDSDAAGGNDCYRRRPDSESSFRNSLKRVGYYNNGGSSCSGEKSTVNSYALAGAILASTNSVLLGYDIGVMSGAALYIKEDLQITSTQEEILVGCLNVCSLIGSLAAGKISDQIGRRYTILLAAVTFFLGAILMGLAPSFSYLIAGRVVSGIGVGFSLMIAPVYSSELSPASTRGFLSSLPEVFINVGILLGYISNYFLSGGGLPSSLNWRVMLGLAAFPALLVGLAVVFMPESPHWLVIKGRFTEAKRVLIRTSSSEEEVELVDSRMNEMVKAISMAELPPSNGFWTELVSVRSKAIRRIVIAAVGVNFFMQASGNVAVVYYSPEVFKVAGISSKKQLFGVTVIMGIAKSSFALASALFIDRFGRRPLLLLGSTGMAVSLALLGLGSKYLDWCEDEKPVWAVVLCVVAVCADVSFFSIGLGPITWVYSSEIFPTRLRAQGSSLAISVNRLVSGVVAMTFLSASETVSFGWMFLGLSGVMVMATAFFYCYLPETKGKTLEEIGVLFEDQDNEYRRLIVS